MDPAPTPATGNSQQGLRVLLLTDTAILTMELSDLLKERVELMINGS